MIIEDTLAGKFLLTSGTRVAIFGMHAQAMFYLQKTVAEYGGTKSATGFGLWTLNYS